MEPNREAHDANRNPLRGETSCIKGLIHSWATHSPIGAGMR
jgi:hypothetical protein